MRLVEDNITVLEKIIENLKPEQHREAKVFQSTIDQLYQLKEMQILASQTGWLKMEYWVKGVMTIGSQECFVIYKGKVTLASYFVKRNMFYWNTNGSGPAMASDCITWVRDL